MLTTTTNKSIRCSSVGNELHQRGKLKRLNTSILNLLSRSQQPNGSEKLNTNDQLQKQESFLCPPSDLSRSISNKSVTFALVFDEMNISTKENQEDLILTVPNKYVTEENHTNNEPYPFRSEIQSDSFQKSNSSTNIIDLYQPKKKFLNFNRPKKLRHPIEVSPINRSTSVPIMFNLSPLINEQNSLQKLSSSRRFKFSSVTRFLQSLIKHPKENPSLKSTSLRKYSEMFY
ncbi:hypothetical protein I4U23_000557 [Adineta vaga]|nr:hypothetical protein I4U23_000557 [Adineta vaga]